ncbi:hypothetical protein V6N12_041931 [Hibiscus sabdariffa]|uniref:Uncharacterized protein n=1 Tax=Hibiscus sabdariffa TaxID=183260 RepID=A0ABR2EDA5_9ROSI
MSTVYGVSGRDRGLVHWSPPLSGWCKPNSDGSRCVDSCRSIREVSWLAIDGGYKSSRRSQALPSKL